MKQGWDYKKLGDICTIERGGSPRPISEYITEDPNGINWIKIGDAVEGSKYINSTKERIRVEGMKKSRFVHKGDFILSNSMSFGKPYILGVDGCIHDGWLVIHDDNNTFIKDYLYYYLSSPTMYRKFESLAVGGVVNNLNSQLVRNVYVSIPPIEEQKAICSLLDKMNRVIEAKKEQLKELDNLAQAIFYDMFGDPVTNEKGWKYCKLADLIAESVILYHLDGNHGGDYPRSEEFVEVGVPYIGANAIINGDVDFSMAKHLTNERAKQLRKGIAKNNDVLFAHNATVGPVAILKTNEEKVILSTSLTAFRCNEDRMSPYFLKSYMKSEWFVCQYKGIMKQATRNQVPITKQKEMLFILPPLPLQQSFAEKVKAIERQKELINQSIKDVQTLFDAKMDYYFGD